MSDNNVKPFIVKPATNEEIVAVIEQWLERAKQGELVAVGLVGVKAGGNISTEWKGAAGGWLHQLISAVSILKYRILAMNIEVD